MGWLANLLSYNFNHVNVTGIDFNPVAIDFANKVKDELKLKTNFIVKDLFNVKFYNKFDLILSIGVLHHTNNCLKGIEKIIELSPKYFLIGLYHKYGKKPFLEHFNNLKLKLKDLNKIDLEKTLFEEYKKLDKRSSNEIHLKSWFIDQVLHPKETRHTLAEILLIIKSKYKIISTSLNKFEQIHNLEQIVEEEEKWFNYGL